MCGGGYRRFFRAPHQLEIKAVCKSHRSAALLIVNWRYSAKVVPARIFKCTKVVPARIFKCTKVVPARIFKCNFLDTQKGHYYTGFGIIKYSRFLGFQETPYKSMQSNIMENLILYFFLKFWEMSRRNMSKRSKTNRLSTTDSEGYFKSVNQACL